MFCVNDYWWEIRFVPFSDARLMRSDGSKTIGMCDGDKCIIYIADGLSTAQEERVICHELTHAFCFSYGIDLSVDEEERLCDFIAHYGRNIIEIADELMTILYRPILMA